MDAVTLSLKQTNPNMTSAQISKLSSARTIFSNSFARLTCWKTNDFDLEIRFLLHLKMLCHERHKLMEFKTIMQSIIPYV